MNIPYLLKKGATYIEAHGAIDSVKPQSEVGQWLGVRLRKGGRLVVKDVRRFSSLRAFPEQLGWHVRSKGDGALTVSILGPDGHPLSSRSYRSMGNELVPVMLAWPTRPVQKMHLEIAFEGESEDGFANLLVHRILDRDWVISQAVGTGVEIGPGSGPKILPSAEVDVSYVEQMAPDRWNALYNKHGTRPIDRAMFARYRIGNASDLPVDDGTQDFIFASHVFEHLSNPIGHLRRWHRKLKAGGKILLIVPDLNGTKDIFQQRSQMSEFLAEEADELWKPTADHYARYYRMPLSSKKVQERIAADESIHVHFYDNQNMARLMDHAVAQLGYDSFVIHHTPNHKDFYVVLKKAEG